MAKILFISKYFYPHIGGVQKHVLKLSRELVKRGHEVTILTHKYDKNLKVTEEFEGINILRISHNNIKLIGLLTLWVQVFKRIRIFLDSDVVHVHDIFIWVLPIKLLLFWKPFYLTNHGWEGIYPIPKKNKFIKQVSTSLASKSISIGTYVNKFYGIKSNLISYGGTDIPKKFQKKKNKIVYVGRLEKDTGLDILLKTLKYFPKLSIEFCGDGKMKKECKKFGKVHGFIDPSRLIKESKICFCGGYLTILEAFANRCVVVTAYHNELKKSYFLDAPFYKWLATGSTPKEIYKSFEEKNSEIPQAFNWVKHQTWQNIAMQYEMIWGLK